MSRTRHTPFRNAFIVVVLCGVLLAPQFARAQNPPGGSGGTSGTGSSAVNDLIWGALGSLVGARSFSVADAATKASNVKNASLVYTVLSNAIDTISKIIQEAVEFRPFDNQYTNCGTAPTCVGAGIRAGSTFLLNLINIVYIFVLLFIAFATILNIEAYSLQRMLPRLVIAILLSNFGLFFVKAISDFGQLLAQGLLSTNIAAQIFNASGAWQKLTIAGLESGSWWLDLLSPILLFIRLLIDPLFWAFVALAIAAIILIARIVGLWLLAIAAPLGIAAGVLPSTAKFSRLFWEKVIKYALVGPVLLFFIKLALIFNTALASTTTNLVSGSFRYFGFAAILFIGILFVRKMGVEVANWTIAGFEKAFKTSLGAVTGYTKFLWVAGKTSAQVGLAAATGGTSLAVTAAETAGLSAAEAKVVGGAAKTFGGNLTSAFGKGFLGSVGKIFTKQGKSLDEFEPKEKEWQNNLDKQSADTQAVAKGRDEILRSEPDIAKTLARPADYQARMAAATSEQERASIAAAFAKGGGMHLGNFNRRTAGITNRTLLDQIRREAAFRSDMRLGNANWTALPDSEKAKYADGWIKSGNPLKYQNRVALQDQYVAQALLRSFEKDPKKADQLSSAQKQWMGYGLRKAIPTLAATQQPRMVLRAAEYGADPRTLYNMAAFRALPGTTQVSIKNTINNTPRFYNNQSGNAAISMLSQVRDPAKAVAVVNNKNLAPEVKAQIAAEIHRGAASAIASPDMRRVLKANLRIAQERAAQAMEQLLQEVKSEAIKARKAAKTAGDLAAERTS